MNKKQIAILLSVAFFSAKSLIAMHAAIFRAVQAATSGVVIGAGAKLAYMNHKEYDDIEIVMQGCLASAPVTHFVHEELRKLNVPHYEAVPVVYRSGGFLLFGVYNDKVIGINKKSAEAIVSGDVEMFEKIKPIMKHEAKHLLNKDYKKAMIYAPVVIPCSVQAISSGLTYGFNKGFNRQVPRSVRAVICRSLMATGAIIPKFIVSSFGLITYCRHQEREADRFAYEHAESREELEIFKKIWDKEALNYIGSSAVLREFIDDPFHPRSAVRSAMGQEYLDKWDAEHKS